jgi:acetyl-CoA carboxylase carboxyltransferase component
MKDLADDLARQHAAGKLTVRERPMVKGTSNMAPRGPPLVMAVVGEDVSAEELGGSKVHCEISGVGDLEVEDDHACLAAIKAYLSYFPSNNTERPPVTPCDDPAERRAEELAFAKDIVVGLARLAGMPVGVVANQPMVLGGALDNDAADKAARFILLCEPEKIYRSTP